jgi:hypothetical protein
MRSRKKEKILGSRRLSNYCWATVVLLGGLAFILAGISSYSKLDILPLNNSSTVSFMPQGVVMTFYGALALSLSLFLWLTIIWNVGAGYNEFNNDIGLITIFRLGFPGKNRSLSLNYRTQDIQSIKIDIREGLTPRREIYLTMKDGRQIPLTRVGQPLLLAEIESQASELAKFLGVGLEGVE